MKRRWNYNVRGAKSSNKKCQFCLLSHVFLTFVFAVNSYVLIVLVLWIYLLYHYYIVYYFCYFLVYSSWRYLYFSVCGKNKKVNIYFYKNYLKCTLNLHFKGYFNLLLYHYPQKSYWNITIATSAIRCWTKGAL